MDIYLKKEYMQYTGSFKERGARYTLLMLEEAQKRKGVIAASAGNHAQAMAYHGGQLGSMFDGHQRRNFAKSFQFSRDPGHRRDACRGTHHEDPKLQELRSHRHHPWSRHWRIQASCFLAVFLVRKLVISSSTFREHALVIGKQKGLMYINGFDHPNILAGQGTCGLEILEQAREYIQTVFQILVQLQSQSLCTLCRSLMWMQS